ncbi:LD-carboxypeptidase [Staphylococcus sp. IVB6181]|uniref:S66 family peptidase n=1 Tax=Staphylococcus sp. IVB6181 TaxID=2929481 RepID=UPI0021CF6E12|nr:S66 peptidase family protein [Staphylococcus sp. IVB6181]UXV34771.1 LD-carboxypeptidase [Staphylococcus sp. IVB6181]
MKQLIVPKHLKRGDTVALISPSSGVVGESFVQYRVQTAIDRLKTVFGLKVKVMPNALKGLDFVYRHPEKRADDIHQALLDEEVKALITFIGGEEFMRIVPFLDEKLIQQYPKIFMGYSDATSIHLKFFKAGVRSYYGPAVLTDFAEHIEMDEYTTDHIFKTLFANQIIGNIDTAPYYRQFGLKWGKQSRFVSRPKIENTGYEVINGNGIAEGKLIGGCFEVLNNLRGTSVFPEIEAFENSILFVENSESQLPPYFLKQALRSFIYMGIFDKISGVIIGKPQKIEQAQMIKTIWQDVLKENGYDDLIVMFNASFGHNEPKCILPYGAQAVLNTEMPSFSISEQGCK